MNVLHEGTVVGEWRSDGRRMQALYTLELSRTGQARSGEPMLCLTRTFGPDEKSKTVRFGLEEVDAVIAGLTSVYQTRPATVSVRNFSPVGFVEVPGYGDLLIG